MVFETILYLFVTVLILFVIIIYWKIIRPQKYLYDVFRAQGISGQTFVPLVGHLSEVRRYRKADLIMEYQEDLIQKHGNIYLFCFGPVMRLGVAEPDILADVFSRANGDNYIKPPIFNAVFNPIIGEQNLLVANDPEHERARRMINPAFHHNHLKSMISIITGQTAKTIDGFFAGSNADQDKQTTLDLQVQFNILTLSIIASSAFGSGYETITNAKEVLCRTFNEVLDAILYRSLILVNPISILSKLPFWKKHIVDEGARLTAELVDQIIAERRQERSTSLCAGPDLLDLLLSAVDNEGKPFTDQQVKEQALTFVLAGSETTGNLMSWVFYVLMTHEHVFQACREEVDRILPNGIEPTNEHLAELGVCEAIISETLRLYPPAPIVTRYCMREHIVGTHRQLRIPVGTTIAANIYALHRRNDLWPRAKEFDYSRWMRDPKTNLKPKLSHAFAYLPFVAGPRNCIGQNFALLEAKIILAMFVQRCDFELIPGQKIVPDLKITMRPKYGLWTKVTRRKTSP